MIHYKHDLGLQVYVNAIVSEHRLDELIREADHYHFRLFPVNYIDWQIDFNNHLKEKHPGADVWKLTTIRRGSVYFIGPMDEVKERISKML